MSAVISRRRLGRLGVELTLGAAVAGLGPSTVGTAAATTPLIPDPRPGTGVLVPRLPGRTMSMAWTVDDGADRATLQAYLTMMQQTQTAITFCPTHLFAASWEACATDLRALIASGQAQLVNHTWSHRVLPTLSDTDVRSEISRNEDWIQAVFGVTSRPYLRPPNGRSDSRVLRLAGELGFTSMLLWDASLGDAAPIPAAQLLANADRGLFPGAVLLGHANAPEVTRHFAEIQSLITQRWLRPATLDQALGTSRETG